MNKIKRFIFNRLFNERQRNVIWQAVLYSEHTYKRRNNAEGVARVRQVINEVAEIAATKQRTYLESQVNEIVQAQVNAALNGANEKMAAAYKEGKAAGVKATIDEMKRYVKVELKNFGIKPVEVYDEGEVHFIKGMKIDRKKCEKCKHANDCFVKAAIDEIEADESEDAKDEKQDATDAQESAEREIPVEGAESAQDTDVADAQKSDDDEDEVEIEE